MVALGRSHEDMKFLSLLMINATMSDQAAAAVKAGKTLKIVKQELAEKLPGWEQKSEEEQNR